MNENDRYTDPPKREITLAEALAWMAVGLGISVAIAVYAITGALKDLST